MHGHPNIKFRTKSVFPSFLSWPPSTKMMENFVPSLLLFLWLLLIIRNVIFILNAFIYFLFFLYVFPLLMPLKLILISMNLSYSPFSLLVCCLWHLPFSRRLWWTERWESKRKRLLQQKLFETLNCVVTTLLSGTSSKVRWLILCQMEILLLCWCEKYVVLSVRKRISE
jgi:hypothetical protein